jgi:hypothetical protein
MQTIIDTMESSVQTIIDTIESSVQTEEEIKEVMNQES